MYTLFLQEPVKFDPRLVFLKIFMIFIGYIVLNFLCSPDFFKIFYNTVMIYNLKIRIMIQHKVRKTKRPALMLMLEESEI